MGKLANCFMLQYTPPYHPCVCAGPKCDCDCHGPKRKKVVKTLPQDPEQFKTTNKDFHTKPDTDDYTQGYPFRNRDNLGSDPNVIPLTTEFQREFTPKRAEIPEVQKPGSWKYGQPIEDHTIQKDHYKSPNKDDYPERALVPHSLLQSGPGEFDTTHKDTYVRPTQDMYQPTGGVSTPRRRETLPGRYNTEYNDKYLGDPTDPSSPYKHAETPLGRRPNSFSTTHRDNFTSPDKDAYPERATGDKTPPYEGPLERGTTTYKEDYVPKPFEDPLVSGRPRETNFIVGPNGPYLSTTHDTHGPKDIVCCPCVLK